MKSVYWRILTLVGCAWGIMAGPEARAVTLVDGNSTVQVNPFSQQGMFQWAIFDPIHNTPVNELQQQWFWYRVGSTGPEHSIDTISAPSILTPNARSLTATYNTNQFSIRIDYILSGGAVVATNAQSDISEAIKIQNLSATNLDFHFYQYSFFQVGAAGGDVVQLGKNIHGLYNEADQSYGINNSLSETVMTPGANHGEAATNGITLGKLNDGSPTTLSDNAGPFGPDDVTWAFEWDLNIAPGATALISKDKFLDVNFVPEPATSALLCMGVGALLLRRRRKV